MSEPSWLSSNISKASGIELQTRSNNSSSAEIKSGNSYSIQNKMEFSSGSSSNLDPIESKIISLQQPQYAFNSPIRRSPYSFETVLESQYGTYDSNYRNSKSNEKKQYNSVNAYSSTALSDKDYEVKGFFLTIPQEQLKKMNSYPTLSPLQKRLTDAFSAGQNNTKGSLVDLIF